MLRPATAAAARSSAACPPAPDGAPPDHPSDDGLQQRPLQLDNPSPGSFLEPGGPGDEVSPSTLARPRQRHRPRDVFVDNRGNGGLILVSTHRRRDPDAGQR
jgi:hypothetical protein